ncbi:MAG TPA: hypothetical protein VLC79_06645 [Cellvibrio sp.]|nr:hypothetical protein [Cellvibrio sp.]
MYKYLSVVKNPKVLKILQLLAIFQGVSYFARSINTFYDAFIKNEINLTINQFIIGTSISFFAVLVSLFILVSSNKKFKYFKLYASFYLVIFFLLQPVSVYLGSIGISTPVPQIQYNRDEVAGAAIGELIRDLFYLSMLFWVCFSKKLSLYLKNEG